MRIKNSIKSVWDLRKIISSLALEDFKKRFVGSYFGVFWMFVQPVVTVIIYYCVFQLGFKSAPPSGIDAPYVLWLIPGIVPWFYFNEAVQMGTGVLYDYNYLVKKVVFKISTIQSFFKFQLCSRFRKGCDPVHFIHDAIYSVLSSTQIAEFNLNIIPYLIKIFQCSRRIGNLTLHLHGP